MVFINDKISHDDSLTDAIFIFALFFVCCLIDKRTQCV